MNSPTYKTGFIGCGNMASAIIDGILNNNIVEVNNLYVYDVDQEKTAPFMEKGVNACISVPALAEQSDIIFLCVKPNIVPEILRQIVQEGKAIVSIAAGITADKICSYLQIKARVMRVMPNTPLLIGQGAICIQTPNDFLESERDFIYRIFSSLGLVKEVRSDQMDAVTGVSGSGPAYVYLFIDSLAKAGEANGLGSETSLELALRTFEGACGMLRETGEPPEELIQKVCSPGGTTIEAMKVFDQRDICGIINEAVGACVRRSEELSK